jgi:hypothetical protein
LKQRENIRALDGPRAGIPIIDPDSKMRSPMTFKACTSAGMNDFYRQTTPKEDFGGEADERLSPIVGGSINKRPRRAMTFRSFHQAGCDDRTGRTDTRSLPRSIHWLKKSISTACALLLTCFLAETVQRLALLRTLSCDAERARIKD